VEEEGEGEEEEEEEEEEDYLLAMKCRPKGNFRQPFITSTHIVAECTVKAA
jgi:hypothetical protein